VGILGDEPREGGGVAAAEGVEDHAAAGGVVA
jgi:hypothetical protein